MDQETSRYHYHSFLTCVIAFKELESLPVQLDHLDKITISDFVAHKAVWHKSWHTRLRTWRNSGIEADNERSNRVSI